MSDRDRRQMNRIEVERKVLRDRIKSELEKLPALIESANADNLNSLDAQVKVVHHFANQLPALNSQILDNLEQQEGHPDLESEIKAAMEFESVILHALNTAENRLSTLKPVSADDAGSVSAASSLHTAIQAQIQAQTQAKLPKLELKSFSGDPIEWQSFWDSFESKVHKNQSISQIDKLHYLIKLVEDEAQEAITGYRPTADNYPVIIAVLTERFGRPETARFKHFEALFALPAVDNDPARLKDVYYECEKHIRCLGALGLTEDTFGKVFVPLILSKQVCLQLHRSHGDGDWDLTSLRKLMKQEILARDLTARFSGFNIGNSKKPDKASGASSKDTKARSGKPWSTQQGALLNSTKKQGATKNVACAFCDGDHYSDDCERYKTADDRKDALKNGCYKCLGTGHRIGECKRTKPCFHCQGKDHHSSLCYKKLGRNAPPKTGSADGKPPSKKDTAGVTLSSGISQKSHAVQKMARVEFPDHDESARAYCDDGSSASYITSDKASKLDLNMSEYKYVSGGRFGSTKRENQRYRSAVLPLPLHDGSVFQLPVYVVDNITSTVQKLPLNAAKYPALNILSLADDIVDKPEMVKIDILIGGDYLHQLLTCERICGVGLYLYGSKLGYIAAGSVNLSDAEFDSLESTAITLFTQATSKQSQQLERFWSLEDIGVKDNPYNTDDERAQELFDMSVKLVNGRYQVGLPWRDGADDLPSHYGLALGRLKSLQNRLKNEPEVLEKYSEVINEQVRTGIVEIVDQTRTDNKVHYVPHHCVIKPSSATTKVRIVYDASAKSGKHSPSLNDSLYRCPSGIQDLCGFLLRFQVPKIALLTDIVKAYHMISIQPSDRAVLRFLWLKDPSKPVSDDHLVVLRYCRVPFGMVSSQFLLSATIKHHLALENTQVATQIDGETYVDNIQGGAEDLPSALTFYKEVKEIFHKIGINARKWYSNCSGYTSKIAPKDTGISDSPKVLGLPWNTSTDVIHSVSPKIVSQCRTKREILSALSTAYDPLGYVCPVVMNAKLVVQDLWTSNYSWDESVSDSIADPFEKIQSDMAQISDLVLPRKINTLIAEKEAEHELHCFADASGKAYTAVVYIRLSVPSGKVSVGLAFAKCRLAPVKAITIPRLELMAAKIGVRLLNFVQHEMATKVAFTSRHLWVDSKCVLYWINSTKKLKTFVHNRVSEIRKSTDVQIRYVPTACNPAHIPSRGMPAAELIDNKLWWEGPSFLTLPQSMWPEQESSTSLLPKEATVDFETQTDTALRSTSEDVPILIDPSRFSKWRKLVRVTAWVLVAIAKFKRVNSDGNLTPSDQHQAELFWIRTAQKSHDCQSQASLAKKGFVLYEDDQGIIRCKGRLEHAKMSPEAKAPVFLPRNHPITQLIIQYCHEVLGHAGVRHTLIQLRRQFWVCQGKRQVSKVIKVCQLCRKVTGGAYKAPPFPPIPDFRVTPSLPFQYLGVDYFGPLLVDH